MALGYVKIYYDFKEKTSSLSPTEIGRLVLAMAEYAETGVTPNLAGNERFVFPIFKVQIDRDHEAYAEKVHTLRENGSKGGRPKNQKVSTETKRFLEKPNESKKSQEKEEEKEEEYITLSCESVIRAHAREKEFVPPTVDEVRTYCEKRKNTVDAEKFVDHYTANGWLIGRTPMKDWKAAVRKWEKSEGAFARPQERRDCAPANRSGSSFDTQEFFEAAVSRSYRRKTDEEDKP